ncbi:MAG TPA: ABC transporter permease subunit, partial [Chloroflexota bacterium]|nr:ABC transporter permease subunit [Chloroflexota bacterium]
MSLLWIILSLPFVNVLYGTVGGLILALLVKEMPLSTQMMRTSFLQISEELEQAARICGASWLAAYRRVMLPIVAPMAVSIFMLLLIDSLRDISTTILLASPSARPLPILMMELATSGNLEGAAVVATIISFLAVAIALLARRVGLRLALADE